MVLIQSAGSVNRVELTIIRDNHSPTYMSAGTVSLIKVSSRTYLCVASDKTEDPETRSFLYAPLQSFSSILRMDDNHVRLSHWRGVVYLAFERQGDTLDFLSTLATTLTADTGAAL